jgi:hypothetical protein
LYINGKSQSQISRILGLGIGTVNRIISAFRDRTIENMRHYADKIFPEELSKCLLSLNAIQVRAWDIFTRVPDTKEKIQALNVLLECSIRRIQLLASPAVIDNANRFVSNVVRSNSNIQKQECDNIESDNADPANAVF